MKVTAKLRKTPNKNGLYPIVIVVTQGSRRAYFTLPYKVKLSEWVDGKVRATNPLAGAINTVIRNKIAEIQSSVIGREIDGRITTLNQIKTMVRGNETKTIKEYVDSLVSNLKGKFTQSTLESYRQEASRLEAFKSGLTFEDITPETLRRYEAHLRGQNLSTNTIHKIWKRLRKFYNSARKDGITEHYPFTHYDNPKYRQTDRTYLTQDEVEKVEAVLKLPIAEYHYRAAVFFLLGCYSGLRVSDWQRFNPSMVKGDRIILRAKKNGELVSMKIHTRLQAVIDLITEKGLKCDSEQKTNEYLKAVGRMAELKKTLTTHVGRHSFAIRCAELGISIETTSALMGITPKSCAYYYKVTNRKVDTEMEKWG